MFLRNYWYVAATADELGRKPLSFRPWRNPRNRSALASGDVGV
jgi:hypothetical protein